MSEKPKRKFRLFFKDALQVYLTVCVTVLVF
jgi:hypothetical protein